MANDESRMAMCLQPEQIVLDADVRDRAHALEVMASEIGRSHGLDATSIFRALWRREQAGSTAVGDGFAVPHASIAGIARPLTVFMRTKNAIAFDAPDGRPVSDLLAILVPTGGPRSDHLNLLALVARLFADPGFRRQLDGAPDPSAAAERFRVAVERLTDLPQ